MRFSNWDILLFPEDSRVPIQEFEVKCQALPQPIESPASERLLLLAGTTYQHTITHVPTLTCFISSLDHGRPFRVSIHSWEKPRPSDLLQSFRPVPEKIIFQARLYIDGKLKSQRNLGVQNVWPEVIDTITSNEYTKPLRFPQFHTEILQQSHWDAGDSLGRIRVVIAEGVAHTDGFSINHGFDKLREVVAFSFQHAPKHILEHSGIAWPNARMFLALTPRPASSNFDAHAHSPRRPSSSAAQYGSLFARKPDIVSTTHSLLGQKWPHAPIKSTSIVDDPFVVPARNSSTHLKSVRGTDVSMRDPPARSKHSSEMSGIEIEQPNLKIRANETGLDQAVRISSPAEHKSIFKTQPTLKSNTATSSPNVVGETMQRNGPQWLKVIESLGRPRSVLGNETRPSSSDSRNSTSIRSGLASWDETPTLGHLWPSTTSDYPGLLPGIHSSNIKAGLGSIGSKRKRSISPTTLLPTEGDIPSNTKGMSTSPCKAMSTPVKATRNDRSPSAIVLGGNT